MLGAVVLGNPAPKNYLIKTGNRGATCHCLRRGGGIV